MKYVKWVVLVLICGLFLGVIIINSNSTDHSDKVWNSAMTMGNPNAKNYYIQYADLACPYCDVFSINIMENEEEFKKDFIEGKDIFYEVRMTDFLYEYGEHRPDMSRWGAEGSYCAARENKFWEYYHAALQSLVDNYYSKGIGNSKSAPMITDMTAEYWLNIGKQIGLSENFEKCFNNHEALEEVLSNTKEATKYVQGGLPYFKFGKFSTGGFDTNWGWDYVKKYLNAGLSK